MRVTTLICVLSLCGTWCLAQEAAPGNDQRLDLVLKYWEQVMTSIQSLEAECVRTTTDKVFKTKETFIGTARFLKSQVPGQPSRASLELRKEDNPNVIEKLILNGFLYEYAAGTKEIRVHELPTPKAGENVDHNLMALLFGMKVDQAKKRYQIQLKEDQHYFYLKIEPRFPNDKADFAEAQLALTRTTYLPRRLQFRQANNNDVIWDLPRVEPRANLRPTDFLPPDKLPPGWKVTRVPAPTPGPSKVRSGSGG